MPPPRKDNFIDRVLGVCCPEISIKNSLLGNNYKSSFTLAKATTDMPESKSKAAFTLAEVLITLGIIGVVAAMTIPTLIANHKKQVVVTKLQKASSVVQQAYLFATTELGGIKPSEYYNDELLAQDPETAYYALTTFYTPYFKTVEVEKGEKGAFAYLPDDIGLYFRRNSVCGTNGFSCTYIAVCTSYKACKNIDESLDIKKVVNGKDVFCIYTNGIAPTYAYNHYDREELIEECKNQVGVESCTAIIAGDGWKISKDYPIRL